ncbi:MAG TPA: ATP-binding protein [Gemmatimonadaceae bacterium]|nr:ATP-binding protein [Gemmatimonadaceae bacterium]
MRLAHRILLFAVALIAVLMLAIGYLIEGRLYDKIILERVTGLSREARLIESQWRDGAEPSELVRTASRALGGRVTLIDTTGVIVADADSAGQGAQRVGTPSRRPEVAEARARTLGVAAGVSPAGNWEELYVAVAGESGITRVAVTTNSLQEIFDETRGELLTVWFLAMAVATFLSIMYAWYVSGPVIELRDLAQALAVRDFRPRKLTPAPGEVGELAHSLQDLAVQLEALERVRREFVANVSHELRTPLTIAGGYAATLAKDDTASERQRQFAQSILGNTTRMQRLVDDLLDLSKLESGAWTPELEQVELPGIAAELVDTLRPAAAAADTRVLVELSPDAQVLKADRVAVRQILANLAENAIRHAPGGTVSIFSRPAPNGIWIGVTDTGVGIPAEYLPRIFERFYRVDTARTRRSGGTGLGLAIVKHLTEAHGGSVEAESTPGVATTIRAFLPSQPQRRLSPASGVVRQTPSVAPA